MGKTTNRSKLMREMLGVVFQHHTCTNMRPSHRENLITLVSGVDEIGEWDLGGRSFSYDPTPMKGGWSLKVGLIRCGERVTEEGDKVVDFIPTISLESEYAIRAISDTGCMGTLMLGAALDELRGILHEKFCDRRVYDVLFTKAEIDAMNRKRELDAVATKLRNICEPLRKNMRVGGSERVFDRKWFEGLPDGRHEFTAEDGHVKKTYSVRLSSTRAELRRYT